jgi:hypothetical protein
VSLGHHLRTLNRYARIEASREFRNALHFCGADVSALYLPIARQHVMLLAPWEMGTAAVATSLRRCGDVRAVLVNCEFYRSGMVAIGAARQEGLTTMGVQHGTIMPMHLIYTPPKGHVLEAPTPDRFAAYSTYARDIVSGCGDYPAERVWVTGAPSLDELATRPSWKRQAREQLDLPCDQSVVLVTTQEYSWFRPAVEAIVRCLTERDDVMLCIKTHPREGSGQGYRQLAKRCHATNVRVFEEHFDALLEACDVICSGSSTTLLEGIVRGRPAVCLNFSGEPDRYPYVDHGGALPGRTPEQLHRSLERALEGDANGELERAREQFLQRHVGPARRGQAAEELARRVLELAGIAPEA